MPTHVAIDARTDSATLVAAETLPSGVIHIIDAKTLQIEDWLVQRAAAAAALTAVKQEAAPESAEEGSGQLDATESTAVPTEANGYSRSIDLSELIDVPYDSTLAILPTNGVLFENLELPFRDPAKLEQVVPLQIQDLVPFDTDPFILDSVVTGSTKDGKYNVLCSLASENDVRSTLENCARIGADPKVLAPLSSALLALTHLVPQELGNNFAMLVRSQGQSSIIISLNGNPELLRELPSGNTEESLQVLAQDVKCSIAKVSVEKDLSVEKCFALGFDAQAIESLTRQGLKLTPVDLSGIVTKNDNLQLSVNDLGWAIGLFANESAGKKAKLRLLDFRKGQFVYKPSWGNFLGAFESEIWYFVLALFFFVVWAGAGVYGTMSSLGSIEDRIYTLMTTSFPGTTFAKRQEVTTAAEELSSLRDQVSDFGSIASLSPLESLQELAQSIPKDIDISIETLSVSRSGISFTGTVADFPQVGKLNSIFESKVKKFCNVKVNSSGRAPGSRVKYTADLGFCD